MIRMGDKHVFHLAELEAVYQELFNHRSQLLTTERYAISGAVIVAGWSKSQFLGPYSVSNTELWSLSFVPLLFLIIGALRAWSHLRHYQRIVDYLRKLEKEFAITGLGYQTTYHNYICEKGKVLGSEFAAPTILKWSIMLIVGLFYWIKH